MSERIDRRIGSNRLLPVTVAAILALAAAAGFFAWHHAAAPAPPSIQANAAPSAVLTNRADQPLTVTLYVPGVAALSAGLVPVRRQPDTQAQAREALNAGFADLRALQSRVLKDIRLSGFFLDAAGTAFVDLSPVQQGGVRASAGEELLALYAVVNTLTQNFEEIKQVRFLVDGREAQTLAGHIDLSRPFTKRMDLVKQ